jgi:mannose-6-phosphate isomerase-like protein (cupin superfamily)/uncharacterized protein (DUF952 family)
MVRGLEERHLKDGGAERVVDTPGFQIDEVIGNVATKTAGISCAHVTAAAGTAEPWLTIKYDEYLYISKGAAVITMDDSELKVTAGQTVYIGPGTHFRPSFPEDTTYTAICMPAFTPTTCIREDETEENGQVAKKLKTLHAATEFAPGLTCVPSASSDVEKSPEVLYHMCPRADWDAAEKSGKAYYPPTFEQDGHLTHATGVPSRLIDTANHYYQDSVGEWICLEFTRTALKDIGIFVRDEQATPVGEKQTHETLMGQWICPHIIGGIPMGIVQKKHVMTRDGPRFTGIPSVDDRRFGA